MKVLCALAIVASAFAQTWDNQLWPLPQSVTCTNGVGTVDASFAVSTNVNSATLSAAIARYTAIYAPLIGGASGTLKTMVLTVSGTDETLSPATNYS